MSYIDPQLKKDTRLFLETLKAFLNTTLPQPSQMLLDVRSIVAASKLDSSKQHLRFPEAVFLNYFAIPKIFNFMQTVEGIGESEARESFLFEGPKNMPQYGSGTPARSIQNPFTKVIGSKPADIYQKWLGTKGRELSQACPDFAFRNPFPYKIVFDGKYIEGGTDEKAASDLAANIYQAFFYRSLPYVPPSKLGVEWDYDFACLLVYDASPDGAMLKAWNKLGEEVKEGFWNGANVYVMILRPDLGK